MYHMSRVTCNMSFVTRCVSHVFYIYIYIYIFFFFFHFRQSDGASRWRVCYQQGLPPLVLIDLLYNMNNNPNKFHNKLSTLTDRDVMHPQLFFHYPQLPWQLLHLGDHTTQQGHSQIEQFGGSMHCSIWHIVDLDLI